ncbi:MAG: ABC transporter substrate-binding protein [Chloroflexi bacterium]|nr:ABC transporter substrate-binding protein [Chloroflexota bacterium]
MKRKMVWLVASCLMVMALLVASCTKAEAPAAKEATPAAKEATPAAKEATPAVKETAAAPEAPKYGGQMILTTNSNFLNWDESYIAMWTAARWLSPVNEELVTGDWTKGPAGSGESEWLYHQSNYAVVTGELAENWEFPDDQTIIFHIRKGVHWGLDPNNAASRLVNGREVTADDIVFNLKREFFDPKTNLNSWAGKSIPVDIYATDKYTVVVKAPPGQLGMTFEYAGEYCRIMAPEVAAKYGDYQKWENSVGTGPFILNDVVPMSSATWVRNPNYWMADPIGPGKGNQLPYVNSYKILIIPDMSTRMAALRTGKIDYDNTTYTAENARGLFKTSPQLKYLKVLTGMPIIGMRMDGYKPGLPWAPQDDPNALKVRRALNMGMNNQAICDTLYGGEGEILSSSEWVKMPMWEGVYTPLDQLPESTRELFEYHPDKAKQLLTEAGYPNGFKTNVIITNTDPVRIDMLMMLKADWAKVGVDLEVKVLADALFTSTYLKKTQEEMTSYGRVTGNPHVGMTVIKGNTWNLSEVNDPGIAKLYDQMNAAYFDIPKRKSIMKEANLYILDKSWYITPPVPFTYYFWQPWVKNYHGESSVGMFNSANFIKYVWIDQELKKSMGH